MLGLGQCTVVEMCTFPNKISVVYTGVHVFHRKQTQMVMEHLILKSLKMSSQTCFILNSRFV